MIREFQASQNVGANDPWLQSLDLEYHRLDREKGVQLLAEVAKELAIPITYVGDGPLRAEIEAMPGATVTGWVARDQVYRHLSTARCLVFPSLWYETYGLTVAEAAAYGVPAIVSDISAAAERVEDGVTGWIGRPSWV